MQIINKNRWRGLILSGLLFLPLVSFAQTITTGDLTGTVKDTSGAVVPDATVTLKSWDTGDVRTATSGPTGNYRFSLLKPGSYQISATTPGLKSDFSRVAVELGQAKTVDLVAKVQATQEVIEVTATAGLMQTDNANMATSFNESQLENLPAPGNDMTAYAFTAPGVTMSTGGGYGSFSVAGLPADSNMFTINGNDNMDPYLNLNNSGASNLTLGANEISEATVVLNGYTGQYGRQAGAQVNYITKSGANEFHGNAAWYYNERVLNANDWFNNANGATVPSRSPGNGPIQLAGRSSRTRHSSSLITRACAMFCPLAVRCLSLLPASPTPCYRTLQPPTLPPFHSIRRLSEFTPARQARPKPRPSPVPSTELWAAATFPPPFPIPLSASLNPVLRPSAAR